MNVLLKLIRKNMESYRVKLFLTLSLIILVIITIFVLFNNIVLEAYLVYSQEKILINVYDELNQYYENPNRYDDTIKKLEKATIKDNINIIIIGKSNEIIYSNSDAFAKTFYQLGENSFDDENILIKNNEYKILKDIDYSTDITYLVLAGTLNNGVQIYLRTSMNSIKENVEIVNNFIYVIAGITILISIVIILYVSNIISKPIIELRLMTKKMKDMDFTQRFKETSSKDEIALLGHNINVMADSLELSIEELKMKNTDLIKDVEEKTKIDEMRTTFISDVSHELKTPIAIIQGYAEGLMNGIAETEEERNYYTEVILDEANKMDRLVKSLLELMKLEYGKREFKNKPFNILKLEHEALRKAKQLFDNKDMDIIFKDSKDIIVYADDFFIEQAFSNYMTNALKYAKEVNGKKYIEIRNEIIDDGKKVRVTVENTGTKLTSEEQNRIWDRFYKVDKSRHRTQNSSGIGLSLVKAIMNNYGNSFGTRNTKNGVEFYFDLNIYDPKKDKNQKKQKEKVKEESLNSQKLDEAIKILNNNILEKEEVTNLYSILENKEIKDLLEQELEMENSDIKLVTEISDEEKQRRRDKIRERLNTKLKEPFDEKEFDRFLELVNKEKNIKEKNIKENKNQTQEEMKTDKKSKKHNKSKNENKKGKKE